MKNKFKREMAVELLRKYGIKQNMIATWANYSTPESFYNSRCKGDILYMVYQVIKHVEDGVPVRPEV